MPPFSNTGAENITPSENRSLIDFLSWSVKEKDVYSAISLSGLSFLDFSESPSGGFGYKKSLRAGNIVVFYDGAENMGCFFSFTGQGCRQYEAAKNTPHCWYQLFHQLKSIEANFTRIDIAIDNVDGRLDLDRLIALKDSKSVQSQFRKWGLHESGTFSEDDIRPGRTFYVGSSESRIRIRFYDKAAQLGIEFHWVRAELQLRAERANEAINHLLKDLSPGQLAVAVLNAYFRPINSESVNKSQCTTQQWWAEWLQTTEKIRLTTAKAIKYVHEVMDYLKRQYAPTIAMCKKYLGVAGFSDFMQELTADGLERMSHKHDQIILASQLTLEYPF